MTVVFICIDGGARKKAIVDKLEQLGIPFIDVAMGLEISDGRLPGFIRVTTITSEARAHFRRHVPFSVENEENVYRNSIQIAELNALNAALAVITDHIHHGL